MRIPIDRIIPDPNQPRKTFDDEAIKELASSFDSYGIISPLKVRPYGGNQYIIIVGELRYRAAKQRRDKEIDCVVQEATDQQAREMQFIENLQRKDIDDLELGRAFHDYCQTYKVSQTELASRLGKEKHYIGERIALITKLSGGLAPAVGKPGGLQFTEAREIATIPDHKRQEEVAQPFIDGEVHSTHVKKIAELARKESRRPIADIIDEVIKGKVEEKEAARLEAAKRALEIPLETPEDLERAAEALKKEAKRKAEEATTPEKKAALEAEERAKAEAQVEAKRIRDEEKKRQMEEQRRRIEERVKRETLDQAFSNPELLKIAVDRAESILPASEVRAAIDYPTNLSDKHLAEVFKAPPETWNNLIRAADKREWTPTELRAVVDIIDDEAVSHEYKAQLLNGEADPLMEKEGQPAMFQETIERRVAEALEQDKGLAFTSAWAALTKLEQYHEKEVIDSLDSFLCERIVKDMPRIMKYLERLISIARERLELWREVD